MIGAEAPPRLLGKHRSGRKPGPRVEQEASVHLAEVAFLIRD